MLTSHLRCSSEKYFSGVSLILDTNLLKRWRSPICFLLLDNPHATRRDFVPAFRPSRLVPIVIPFRYDRSPTWPSRKGRLIFLCRLRGRRKRFVCSMNNHYLCCREMRLLLLHILGKNRTQAVTSIIEWPPFICLRFSFRYLCIAAICGDIIIAEPRP